MEIRNEPTVVIQAVACYQSTVLNQPAKLWPITPHSMVTSVLHLIELWNSRALYTLCKVSEWSHTVGPKTEQKDWWTAVSNKATLSVNASMIQSPILISIDNSKHVVNQKSLQILAKSRSPNDKPNNLYTIHSGFEFSHAYSSFESSD